MTETQDTAVTVSHAGADIVFRSWRQVDKWIDEVTEAWGWLRAVPGSDAAGIKNYVPQRLDAAKRDTQNAISSGQPLAYARSIFSNHLSDGYAPPHPRTDLAKSVFEVRDIAGPEAGMFAYGVKRNLLSYAHVQSNAQWLGLSLSLTPALLAVSGEADRFKRERTNYRNSTEKLFEDFEAREAARDQEWQKALTDAAQNAASWSRTLTRRQLRTSLKARARERGAMAKLHATDLAFTEKMALKAPVEYWDKKAAKHKTAENEMQGWLWLYFPLAFLLLVGMFGGVGYYLLTTPKADLPPGLTIVASAGLATAAGMLFWVGRLLTKLYLSQHHLRQDAEERATMTTTYLALTEVSAAGDADRQIVLNALFRSTPDGIVKDEGGLDPSFASALGRFLAR